MKSRATRKYQRHAQAVYRLSELNFYRRIGRAEHPETRKKLTFME